MSVLKKIHLPAILSGATTVIGVLSLPQVLHFLPEHVGAVVIAVGAVLQAVTHPVQGAQQTAGAE